MHKIQFHSSFNQLNFNGGNVDQNDKMVRSTVYGDCFSGYHGYHDESIGKPNENKNVKK